MGVLREHGAAARRRLFAELLGSAFLAAIVIGSGIAAASSHPANRPRTVRERRRDRAGLFAIILMFGPVSGGAFQPGRVARRRELRRTDLA